MARPNGREELELWTADLSASLSQLDRVVCKTIRYLRYGSTRRRGGRFEKFDFQLQFGPNLGHCKVQGVLG